MQEEFRLELNEILKGNQNYKSKDQISTIKNIRKLDNGREKVLNFYNDYTGIVNTNQFMEKGSKNS